MGAPALLPTDAKAPSVLADFGAVGAYVQHVNTKTRSALSPPPPSDAKAASPSGALNTNFETKMPSSVLASHEEGDLSNAAAATACTPPDSSDVILSPRGNSTCSSMSATLLNRAQFGSSLAMFRQAIAEHL